MRALFTIHSFNFMPKKLQPATHIQQSLQDTKNSDSRMDIFLAYLLYKRRQVPPQPQPDWIETSIAIMVLIAGLAKLAALCKGRP